MFGPAAATVVVVLDTLVISFWLGRSANPPSRLLFNVSAPAVAIWLSSHAFFSLTGIVPLALVPQPIIGLLFPLFGLAVLYFLLNSWLIAFAVAFQKRQSAFLIWRNNLLWLSLNYFSGASVAALLLPYLLGVEYAFIRIAGILLPILTISYLTLKTALGRVEDANRHFGELRTLYLSTIETLAMAIDAKDQITHGHIRRVQRYAIGLAKHLGVSDPVQISAIEAASLLHDMGKLAIPEYILNKPGRLTETEFEKMKAHAAVGADILSAIDFPYPVVPIVRHHHEHWDGHGYPDGISGTAIPIGARILSVVDCFDALTSDRPYRPRLPDDDAIKIVLQRRGTMYDPLVVDAFLEVHGMLIAEQAEATSQANEGLAAISRGTVASHSTDPGPRLDDISSSTGEMMILFDLANNLSGQLPLTDAAEIISNHLRHIVPAAVCVFYIYDGVADEIRASFATGDNASHFNGLAIPRGQRLSGWVAANVKTIVNSDPVLDLGEAARGITPRLLSCLSTPLVCENQLVGVLSLYSVHRDHFTEEHRRIVEAIARQASKSIKSSLDTERAAFARTPEAAADTFASTRTPPHGVPSLRSQGLSILLVHARRTRSSGGSTIILEQQLRGALVRIGPHVPGSVEVLPYADDEMLVLLRHTGGKESATAAAKLLADYLVVDGDSSAGCYDRSAGIGVASAPGDGRTVEELVATARQQPRIVERPSTTRQVLH
jgi:putative nucleotidyltransferase with HDIG domain